MTLVAIVTSLISLQVKIWEEGNNNLSAIGYVYSFCLCSLSKFHTLFYSSTLFPTCVFPACVIVYITPLISFICPWLSFSLSHVVCVVPSLSANSALYTVWGVPAFILVFSFPWYFLISSSLPWPCCFLLLVRFVWLTYWLTTCAPNLFSSQEFL